MSRIKNFYKFKKNVATEKQNVIIKKSVLSKMARKAKNMSNFLKKFKCDFTFERKGYACSDESSKSKGRSMLETLGVLLVLGLLTVFALKGVNVAMDKATANKVLDDAADVYSKLSVSKRNYETWSLVTPAKKSRSGYDFLGIHSLKDTTGEAGGALFVTYARATIPQSICKPLIDMQSKRMSIYKANAENTVSTTPMTECEEQNDMIFSFNFAPTCTSDKDCTSKYGSNYSCVKALCLRKTTCSSANDCPNGYSCISGECRYSGCSTDSDCPNGKICERGTCIEEVCAQNSDCMDGYKCVEGKCIDSCEKDSDCLTGYICRSGECTSAACSKDVDCPSDYICKSGKCASAICPPACPSGYTCTNGKCRKNACTTDANCPAGYKCLNGICKANVCLVDSDCGGFGYKCVDGICKNFSCSNDMDCKADFGATYICVNGKCQNLGCSSASDCNGTGFVCQTGKCVCSSAYQTCTMTGSDAVWCCNKTTEECSTTEENKCNSVSGKCHYTLETNEMAKRSNCVYSVGTATTGSKYADCKYKLNNTPTRRMYNCKYTLSISTVNGEPRGVMTAVKGCSGKQYCNMKWANEYCDTAAAADATTIYGVCSELNSSNSTCLIDEEFSYHNPTVPLLEKLIGCPDTQYCNLNWSEANCGSTAPANAEIIFGTCLERNNFSRTCKSEVIGVLSPISKCPKTQYCNLKWSEPTCTTAAAADAVKIYGTCLERNNFNAVCMSDDSNAARMVKVKGCASGKYCNLKYKDDQCTAAGAADTDLWGQCLARNVFSYTCTK